MGLENQLKQKKRLIRRCPPAEALAQVEKGNKFIIVEDGFDLNYVPERYTLIDMKHKGSSLKTLVPQSLLFFMANPGEGDSNNALEEIADFYDEAKDFEDELIENGEISIQGTNWATLARNSYETYLVNKLVKHKDDESNEGEESVPEFNPEVLLQLDLDDDYVSQRVKALAAVALGKTSQQVKNYNIGDVLKHVTIREKGKAKELSKKEFERVACHCGSHYELKSKFESDPDYEYDVIGFSGTKTPKKKQIPFFDAKIGELEREIAEHRQNKHGKLGRHDQELVRQYANLAHITLEDPRAQLDIIPPEKIDWEVRK